MSNEELLSKYEKMKNVFNKALKYLGYDEIPLNGDTLEGIMLELQDRKDETMNVSVKEKNALFLVDLYNTFLMNFYPKIEAIVLENEVDTILSAKLIPEVRKLNAEFILVVEMMLKKYELTKNTLLIDDPFLGKLADFKSLFLGRTRPYPDFDYNINSWREKRKKIEQKIAVTELFLETKLGSNYQKCADGFSAGIIKNELENIMPIYNEIFKNEAKIK